MFYYVNGTVAETGPNLAVIDCGGVGYACATTNYTLSQLKKGERAKLYTHLHVREDIFELYGFSSQAELNSFRMLIGVSGVGPKAALSVLSAATGIWKKIAQRIILELKDKLAKEQSSFSAQGGGAVPVSLPGDKGNEAAAALAVLGYGSQEISLALKGVDMDALPLEEIIRQALKKMVR